MYDEASNSTILMLLNTAVYPFIGAFLISFIASRISHKLSVIGFIGGFLIGLGLIHSGLSFPPKQAIDYYSISAIIGLIIFFSVDKLHNRVGQYIVTLILAFLSFFLLLNPVLKYSGLHVSVLWGVVSGLITLLYILSTRYTYNKADQRLNLLPLIGLMIVAGATAPVISIGGSLLIGQLLGAFGAALFAHVIIAYFITNKAVAKSSIPGILILGGLITQSHVLADIPLTVMILAVISCFVTPVALILLRKRNAKQKILSAILLQIIISGAITGISLWLVWPESSLY